jgi:hypothetical protein
VALRPALTPGHWRQIRGYSDNSAPKPMFRGLPVGYFPFICLANTIFNRAARFRTAASLRFICSAIFAALAPDKARVRRRI